MLVLSRNVGSSIIIDHDIKVIVLGVSGNQVRIGVEAPLEVEVNRLEVHERIYGAPEND